MEKNFPSAANVSAAIDDTKQNTAEMIDSARIKLADALEKGSESLMNGALAVEEGATAAAAKLSDSATYLRDHSNGEMWSRCCEVMGRHPLQVMTLAAIGGLLLGRALWRRTDAYVE